MKDWLCPILAARNNAPSPGRLIMLTISEEKMSGEFTKQHLKGLPFGAVIHHFTAQDTGSPHDHPFSFTSHILSGGYIEKVFHVDEDGKWTSEWIDRKPGTVHTVEATHIHQITDLPEGECYTLIIPKEKVREPRFWKFDENGSQSRAWYEGDYE
ncbi:MAG TPA: hypothetical protein VNI84_18235 [Pyrinomonadaceae bacterium]|nr:hypothetical protein [Pyrinomonadaceae bacterium]